MDFQALGNRVGTFLADLVEPAQFEAICEDYLKTFPEYRELYTKGRNIKGKIIKGIPDSLSYDFEEGSYLAYEYSIINDNEWDSKAKKSIIDVARFFKDKSVKCNRIIVCTNKEASPEKEIGLRKVADEYALELDLHDLRRIREKIVHSPVLLYKHCRIEPQIRYFEIADTKLKARRMFPRLQDFENKLVFINRYKTNDVLAIFEGNNKCLIYGKPASGKTVFSFALRSVETFLPCYLDIRGDFDPDKILHEILLNNNNQIIYILDNCHIWPAKIYQFIERIEANNIESKFLFISRNIDKTFLSEGENYFELLRDYSIPFEADRIIFKNIIALYEKYKFKTISNYSSPKYNLNAVVDQCGHNLFILSLLLEAWDPEKSGRSLDDVKEDEILNRVSQKYLEPYHRNIERNHFLISMCALYQFEIPIEESFFYSQIKTVPKDIRDCILTEGIIEVQKGPNETLYTLPHSTFASLILRAAEKKSKELLQGRFVPEYTKDICLEYLEKEPVYILDIIHLLVNNGRKDIATLYCGSHFFASKLNQHLAKIHLSRIWVWLNFLNALDLTEDQRQRIIDDRTMQAIAGKLKVPGIQRIVWVIKELQRFHNSKAEMLLDYSKDALREGLKNEKFKNIVFTFEFLAKLNAGLSVARDMLDAMDINSDKFMCKIEEEKNLTNFRLLFKHLAKIDKSLIEYFLSQISANRLSQIFKNKKVTIKHLTIIYEYANKIFIQSFGSSFDKEFYIQALNNSRLNHIGKYYRHYAEYIPSLIEAFESFARDHLTNKLREASISDIQQFIFHIGKAEHHGESLAKSAISRLRQIDVGENVERGKFNYVTKVFEPTQLIDIVWLLRNVNLFEDPAFIVEQLKYVDLTHQLKGADLDTIAHFLWNVFTSDRDLAKDYCENVYKTDLKEKILKAKHNEINLFLWNIFQISDYRPDIFIDKEIRRVVVQKSDEGNFIDSLQTIGIFEAAECSLSSEISKHEVNEKLLFDYLENSLTHPFALLRTLKGLKTKDELILGHIFQDNLELRRKIEIFLVSFVVSEMTIKTRSLLDEILDFLERSRHRNVD